MPQGISAVKPTNGLYLYLFTLLQILTVLLKFTQKVHRWALRTSQSRDMKTSLLTSRDMLRLLVVLVKVRTDITTKGNVSMKFRHL